MPRHQARVVLLYTALAGRTARTRVEATLTRSGSGSSRWPHRCSWLAASKFPIKEPAVCWQICCSHEHTHGGQFGYTCAEGDAILTHAGGAIPAWIENIWWWLQHLNRIRQHVAH